jgi:hypothetical protein
MPPKTSTHLLIELPVEIQTTLFLIREELKSRKFFNGLQELGLNDTYFQPHLDKLILRSLGMDDHTDEIFERYYEIIDRRSSKIKANKNSVMKQAFKAYYELMDEKKRRWGRKK